MTLCLACSVIYNYNVYMWSLTVLGLLAAETIFNVLGMVGLSLIVVYSGAYNKCKTIQTLVGRGGNDGKGKKSKCLGTAR